MHGQYFGHTLTIDYGQKAFNKPVDLYFKPKEINITLAVFKEG